MIVVAAHAGLCISRGVNPGVTMSVLVTLTLIPLALPCVLTASLVWAWSLGIEHAADEARHVVWGVLSAAHWSDHGRSLPGRDPNSVDEVSGR